jgi:hypothetical protein
MSQINTNTEMSVQEQLVALEATKAALAAKVKQARVLQAHSVWEAGIKIRNPAYVLGSLRPATDADVLTLGHSHGWVCEVQCVACSKRRVINKQDAFQVRACIGCKSELRKAKAKEIRASAKLSGVSLVDLQAQIAELSAQLAMQDKRAAAIGEKADERIDELHDQLREAENALAAS